MRTALASLALPTEYPSPAVKWLGGKTNLIDQIIPLLPPDVRMRRWHEPFVGGGALFFRLLPNRAVLSDTCIDLIQLYIELQIGPSNEFVAECMFWSSSELNDREWFSWVRREFNSNRHKNIEQRAAWFLYLNRACFNGLHRINSKGEFNAPFGDGKPISFDFDNLRACGNALRSAELHCTDFAQTLDRAREGDVIYFDPPFLDTFSDYSGKFGIDQHERLCDVFRALDARGCIVVLSTGDHPLIRKLYEGFEITVVRAARAVGARAASRGKVDELVIRGHSR